MAVATFVLYIIACSIRGVLPLIYKKHIWWLYIQ